VHSRHASINGAEECRRDRCLDLTYQIAPRALVMHHRRCDECVIKVSKESSLMCSKTECRSQVREPPRPNPRAGPRNLTNELVRQAGGLHSLLQCAALTGRQSDASRGNSKDPLHCGFAMPWSNARPATPPALRSHSPKAVSTPCRKAETARRRVKTGNTHSYARTRKTCRSGRRARRRQV